MGFTLKCLPTHQEPERQSDHFPRAFDRSSRVNKSSGGASIKVIPHRGDSPPPLTWLMRAAQHSESREKEGNRKYISVEHAMNWSEMLREALGWESLGTTHCRHYIALHYIRQPLHLRSCSEAERKKRRLSLSAAERKRTFSREVRHCAFLLPVLPHLPTPLYLRQPV